MDELPGIRVLWTCSRNCRTSDRAQGGTVTTARHCTEPRSLEKDIGLSGFLDRDDRFSLVSAAVQTGIVRQLELMALWTH
jgi:hypothetical protein